MCVQWCREFTDEDADQPWVHTVFTCVCMCVSTFACVNYVYMHVYECECVYIIYVCEYMC